MPARAAGLLDGGTPTSASRRRRPPCRRLHRPSRGWRPRETADRDAIVETTSWSRSAAAQPRSPSPRRAWHVLLCKVLQRRSGVRTAAAAGGHGRACAAAPQLPSATSSLSSTSPASALLLLSRLAGVRPRARAAARAHAATASTAALSYRRRGAAPAAAAYPPSPPMASSAITEWAPVLAVLVAGARCDSPLPRRASACSQNPPACPRHPPADGQLLVRRARAACVGLAPVSPRARRLGSIEYEEPFHQYLQEQQMWQYSYPLQPNTARDGHLTQRPLPLLPRPARPFPRAPAPAAGAQLGRAGDGDHRAFRRLPRAVPRPPRPPRAVARVPGPLDLPFVHLPHHQLRQTPRRARHPTAPPRRAAAPPRRGRYATPRVRR